MHDGHRSRRTKPAVAALSERAVFDVDDGRVVIDGHDVARGHPHARDRSGGRDRRAASDGPPDARRAAAALRRARRRGDGRTRHRHGRVPAGRREDLSGCVARGARAPPRRGSGAHVRKGRALRKWPPRSPNATAATRRARRRRSPSRPTPSSSIRPAFRSRSRGTGVDGSQTSRVDDRNAESGTRNAKSRMRERRLASRIRIPRPVSPYPDSPPPTPGRVPSGACRGWRSCRTPLSSSLSWYSIAERLADVVDAILIGRRIVAARGFVADRVGVLPVRVDVAAGQGGAGLGVLLPGLAQRRASGACGRAVTIHVQAGGRARHASPRPRAAASVRARGPGRGANAAGARRRPGRPLGRHRIGRARDGSSGRRASAPASPRDPCRRAVGVPPCRAAAFAWRRADRLSFARSCARLWSGWFGWPPAA